MRRMRIVVVLAAALVAAMSIGQRARAETPATPVAVFAAGSLASAMKALIAEAGLDTPITPTFGPAGLLGDRLAKGEAADLFASADLAAPARIAERRPGTLVVPFARNRMCLAAGPAVGLTAANALDTMLAPDLRLATSTPGADPGGDYALAVFKRAELIHPGAEVALTAKMLTLVGGPATMTPVNGRSPSAAIFLDNKADLFLYYCSSSASLLKDVPDLTSVPLPEPLEVHPVYGLGVLTDTPAALRFALFMLSTKGQAILARFGLEPLTAQP